MGLHDLENKLHDNLKVLELKLIEQAVFEDSELEYFKDEAVEVFDEFQYAIEELLLTNINNIKDVQLNSGSLPLLIACKDIYDFKNAINLFNKEYPIINEYVEALDTSLINFEPLYFAIRGHFRVETISQIADQKEFKFALSGYINLGNIYHEYFDEIPKDEIFPEIKSLIKSPFISQQDREELEELLQL